MLARLRRRTWALTGVFLPIVYLTVLRPRIYGWGTCRPERLSPLPGDAVLPHARGQVTHAITIQAPAAAIWPWLVQLGCHRAGWYSYDWLDNAGIPSATAIVPAFQQLEIGDRLPAIPGDPDGFEVVSIAPNRALVLRVAASLQERPALRPPLPYRILGRFAQWSGAADAYWRVSWAFVLREESDGTTRLLSRNRADFAPYWILRPIVELLLLPIHHVMQRKQLLEIKARVERSRGMPVAS